MLLFCCAALCKGVSPYLLTALMSAPLSNKTRMISTFELKHVARWRAVQPYSSTCFKSPPLSSKYCTTSGFGFPLAAWRKADCFDSPNAWTLAPLSIKRRVISTFEFKAADRWRAVSPFSSTCFKSPPLLSRYCTTSGFGLPLAARRKTDRFKNPNAWTSAPLSIKRRMTSTFEFKAEARWRALSSTSSTCFNLSATSFTSSPRSKTNSTIFGFQFKQAKCRSDLPFRLFALSLAPCFNKNFRISVPRLIEAA